MIFICIQGRYTHLLLISFFIFLSFGINLLYAWFLFFFFRKIPTMLEYFSYVFHFQALMAGPVIFYRDYIDFIHGRNIGGTKALTVSFFFFNYYYLCIFYLKKKKKKRKLNFIFFLLRVTIKIPLIMTR